jgi:hypothetical protein
MDGAKVNHFFNLLQVKIKKIIAEPENLTFATAKDPFLWDEFRFCRTGEKGFTSMDF